MPKRKRPEPPSEEQFKEFVATARKVGADEDGTALERVFKKLAPKKRAQKSKAK